MVDYYELLEISRDAGRVTIEQAIKKTRRLWNNRANNPDASIRAEAERHVREIAEAEKILLDDKAREKYNRDLDNTPKDTGDNGQSNALPSDWEDEFFRAYNKNVYDYAIQIAQSAINANNRNGRAWFLYGEALRSSGDADRAIEPLLHASLLIPNDVRVYRQLGFAYMNAGNLVEAVKAFNKATECDPDDVEFYCLRAEIGRKNGLLEDALKQSRRAYEIDPNSDDARFQYFYALYENALRTVSYNRSSGKHLITNKAQLDYTNALLRVMAMTIPNDNSKSDCTRCLEEIAAIVADAERKVGGLFSSKLGYQYNYSISNAETRATGRQQ